MNIIRIRYSNDKKKEIARAILKHEKIGNKFEKL